MKGKRWYQSKTFWFNVIALAVLVANAFGYADFTASKDVQDIALVIITTVNLVLRFVTKEPIR